VRKVLLLITCDGCRRLYEFSRTTSEDTTAWYVHGDGLIQMAIDAGWLESHCRNYHYCSICLRNNPLLKYA
jgi:hypothetical protein